jgi:electron transport complex protein RnfG
MGTRLITDMKKFKIDREQIQMVMALVAVAVVAVLFLGLTDIITREPIAEARKAALHKALVQVLPEHDNDPLSSVIHFKASGSDMEKLIYPAKDKQGNIIGFAWETIAPDGYSGTIRIMMGVFTDGTVHAIRITDHRETPGLGDGIVNNAAWLGSFVGKTLDNTRWAVRKDRGDFDQFTGATLTPRAVIKAVKAGLEMFKDNRDKLLAPPAPSTTVKTGKGETQ